MFWKVLLLVILFWMNSCGGSSVVIWLMCNGKGVRFDTMMD